MFDLTRFPVSDGAGIKSAVAQQLRISKDILKKVTMPPQISDIDLFMVALAQFCLNVFER